MSDPVFDLLETRDLEATRAAFVTAITTGFTASRRYARLEAQVARIDDVLRSRGRRYLLHLTPDGRDAISCLTCHRTSYNQGDVEHHYCGHCKVFHDDAAPTGTV